MKNHYFYTIIVLIVVIGVFVAERTEDGAFVHGFQVFRNDVSILNFGDVMFDRGVRNIIENRGRDPFEYMRKDMDRISGYDEVIVNLEGPIVTMDRSTCQQKAYNFQFASDTPQRLKSIGVTMVNLANNHNYDCFQRGSDATKVALDASGIAYMGDKPIERSYVEKTIGDKKVAFIGIDESVAPIPVSSFYPLVRELKGRNDLVIVDIHWGTEYLLTENASQAAIAHALIDSGADIIFGHHPHVIEPVRIYKGKAIFYSLGNFVFDQNFGDTTRGLGAGAVFEEGKTKITLYPFNIKVFAPQLMSGEEEKDFCDAFLRDIPHAGCTFEMAY